MSGKNNKILVAGASGLVGVAAIRVRAELKDSGGPVSENGIVDQANKLILYVFRGPSLQSGLDRRPGACSDGLQRSSCSASRSGTQYTIEMLVPMMISHSPVVFWLLPVFGVRGAGYFLATTETIFGTLIFLRYWSPTWHPGRAWINRNFHRHHDHYSLPAGCLGT